ncbi:LuxR family transcriptional regulator [Rhodoferax sp. UBA5149]|uniref:LuxR family transcriptional regulator n=1 Tax=Rhodoferax sp. UBA5149 TaxID=1947379 RepID=UPI0025D1C050|nr:LuxR family transcriptional regulator [Rhodoferax sp. UBA5149]
MARFFDPCELLASQRQLRGQLLDRQGAITWRHSRELAAQLLLRLDDPDACWQFSAEWIREAFDVERVDGGYGSPGALTYEPAAAEARSKDIDVPSLRGVHINNFDPAVIQLWTSSRPIVYTDISQEKLFRSDLRENLLAVGTYSKIAVALQHQGHRFGLLCIDHVEKHSDWRAGQYECFDNLSREVLGPILSASARLGDPDDDPIPTVNGSSFDAIMQRLTPAETRVARLAASGMSYKEIARALNRSFSTVDHQLRSIRHKLEVTSTARLIKILSSPAPSARL